MLTKLIRSTHTRTHRLPSIEPHEGIDSHRHTDCDHHFGAKLFSQTLWRDKRSRNEFGRHGVKANNRRKQFALRAPQPQCQLRV